jgi:hypothetical protein
VGKSRRRAHVIGANDDCDGWAFEAHKVPSTPDDAARRREQARSILIRLAIGRVIKSDDKGTEEQA